MSYSSDLIHLSLLQIQALVFLHNNKDVQMRTIASQFNIEMPTATNLIANLVREKLIMRKEDKEDRRLVRIGLTAKGKRLLNQVMKERSKKMSVLLSYLSKKEKKNLLRITSLLIDKMGSTYEK